MLKRIRCFGMTQEAMTLVQEKLGSSPLYEASGFNASGLAKEEDIQALEAAGIIVERIPDELLPIGWLEPSAAPPLPQALSESSPTPDSQLGKLAESEDEYFVLQFTGPLTSEDRKNLDEMEVKLGGYVPEFAYKTQLTQKQEKALQECSFVRRVVHFDAALTLRRMSPMTRPVPPKSLLSRMANLLVPRREQALYHVRCHNAADIPAVAEALSGDERVLDLQKGRHRIRISVAAGKNALALQGEIARLPQVSVVEPFEFPTLMCSFMREVMAVESPGLPPFPWRGKGQLIGIADTGIDLQHPDLTRSIAKYIERTAPSTPNDPAGHGTHVSSIIAGDGTASNGLLPGIAPEAKLVVQAIYNDAERKFDLPVDLGDLFQEAYDEGVRIHNNSWGWEVEALYTTDAFELDKFVFDHPDCLLVVAAGNSGNQPNPLDPADPTGRIAYNSLNTPGTAKNVITVGACCSTRLDGPFAAKTWKDYRGKNGKVIHPPLANAPICGNAEVLAAFSSRGPTDDTRIKPDLVVPGTAILAAKSSASEPLYPEPQFNGHYAYLSGTSMAAPAVAGSAAIVRQYYTEERTHDRPLAALLKATLINGTEWSGAIDAQDENVGMPNFHQGFGRLDMRKTLPIPGNAEGFSLQFIDIDNNAPQALNSNELNRKQWIKRIQVEEGIALSITLCWTDYPAHGLQNQLDLSVKSPTGQVSIGNGDMRRDAWAKMDRYNNVERVRVENPVAGQWTVMVNAFNTPFPSQGFSLVATGKNLTAFF